MQEHPIPQDITGYRFHIIGSMTLKQFGEVLLGAIIAFIIFKTNLISFVKWPLVILSAGLGAAAAFLPIEERPLDHWIITFFKTMYKPTKFYWRRVPNIPEPFKYEPPTQDKKEEITLDLTPAKRQRIKEYVGAIPEVRSTKQDFTSDELLRMQNILSSFTDVKLPKTISTTISPVKEKPRIDVRVRKMRKPAQEITIFEDNLGISLPTHDEKNIESMLQQSKVVLSSEKVAQNINIPEPKIIKANMIKDEEILNEFHSGTSDLSEKSFQVEPDAAAPSLAQDQATYNINLPFPIQPSEPNKVVGMVLSKNNDLITGAIVEIQTPEGSIARAVKTNTLGQFFVTTPLKPGDYNINIEKEGFVFQPQHIVINNTIIPPLEIRSDN